MAKKPFLSSGHTPTLISAFLYFDISFMVWVLFGPMTPFIAEHAHLSATEKGLLTAIPLLGGSFFRPVLGLLADRIGGRRAGLIGLMLTLIPLALGWRVANQLWQLYLVGFLLGIAGASFAVALPLAGRWYSAEHQGLALGIAGAGNSGTLTATLLGPRLAERYGWHFVFGTALLPVVMVLAIFSLLARNSPSKSAPQAWGSYRKLLGQADAWRLCLLYSITFGGFVGITSFLPVFFHDQYRMTKIAAGDFSTLVVLSGSFLRPVGGWIADRTGGYRLLIAIFGLVFISLLLVSTLPKLVIVLPLLFLVMGLLGMGNGAVFQIAPQRFPADMELLTGIVGAAGGLGGFLLPFALGLLRDLSGTYATGLFSIALVLAAALVFLLEFGILWSGTWHRQALSRTRVFAYRRSDLTGVLPARAVESASE